MRFRTNQWPRFVRLAIGLAVGVFAFNHQILAYDFATTVRPILSDACYHCHGPDADARAADLRFDQRDAAMASGVLSSGELLARLTSDDPELRMPPPNANRPLRPSDRQILTDWASDDAPWPEDDRHWAFVPPKRPGVPDVSRTDWPINPIDRFVLDRLEREQLEPSPAADKATLLRRFSFDLTGLAPSEDDLQRFLLDESPDAYERAVDRLLQSPRYGEHMAVGWLEAARFADTDGYQNDRLRYMWVWRDWVIHSLNQNLPFDQFVTQQLAGDLILDRNFMTQVATGFQRNHRINSEAGSIPEEWLVEYVADRVETTGTMFLGLTINCARCHDHKYDPITQAEFYKLFAFFNGIDEAGLGPNDGNSPPFVAVPQNWPSLSDEEMAFVVPDPMEIRIVQGNVPRPQAGSPETVMVMHELPKPRTTYLLRRGQYDQPDHSQEQTAAIPEAIGNWDEAWPRNRLGLANWLTDARHPLTSRVTVNRFWQHFFGTGLVKTSENFGIQGDLPSHPELLDWLATEFIRQGWDMKAMHRLIVTSATYRQRSIATAAAFETDPENRFLSRGPRKRLSPFAIRDSVLQASGLLEPILGGPSVKPYMPPGIWSSISNSKYKRDDGASLYRRSLYTYWRRTLPPPTMMAFNAAARETCIVRSDQTTTPLQALTLMNNVTFVEAARQLAAKAIALHDTPREQITRAFVFAIKRFPSEGEVALLCEDFETYCAEFAADPAAAEKLLSIGESCCDDSIPKAQLAALTLVCNTIFNLDESITLN
ncbi:PSD1 and planctomycete cytochrome C domain-containing protein [Rhodopirellula sp. MGV]|uniref:PSD1 and planctomycete cytochrome C domain-containing protein n=1 Tax=Rhodopirellula sp. MGV TaxID=2023130 RepID=UPI000B969BA9|nr:PSD1 and planctomycete cytochrome C domain-containing protein [Rhodopirellula sp. MGV]OYP34738.1 hypothetical protein CGZ80_14000 [Rhodopirellula sp. MGV]PNY34307.1 DUF1553 domain-containing protein [Rhodopirellula baltica]